ncbi:MAG: HAD-IIIA family hydrolase, partial [Alphaproteobacteria bacterium]|nr:HAD-IIIA family hydrolase [Alphaproteobacteria bacterium]
LSVDKAFSAFLPNICEAKLKNVVRDFEDVVQTQIHSKDYVEPLYTGVHECLQQLEKDGVLLGIATGNSRRGLDAFLERQGLEKMFINTKTADENLGKPNPEMLLQAMKEVGAEPDMTVMIGDTVYDILMAGNAGVGSIGVSWGSHGKKELLEAGANEIIDSLSQTKGIFDKITLRDVT